MAESSVKNYINEYMVGVAEKEDFEVDDANEKQIELGLEVEQEHTPNPSIAKEIVMDHLAEIQNYYTLLESMEDKAVNV